MKTIKIPYRPRPFFLPFHNAQERWKVIVAHRRAGKSTAVFNHLQRDAFIKKESKYAFIAPFRNQAKGIIWDIVKHYSGIIPKVEYNEAELSVKYPNGSKITLYGADNPDALRGLGFDGVVFDEYSQQPSNIFGEIIRPALADRQGYAIWIGTPKGKNEFWKLYEEVRDKPDWFRMLLTAEETQILPQEELEDAKKNMSEDEYAQEFMCNWEAAIKGAYYAKELAKAREEERIGQVLHDSALSVHTFWDLGIRDATAILFAQTDRVSWRIIDAYQASGESLAHFASILQEKRKIYNYGRHYAPHDIEVRELGTGKSRKEIARDLGISFEVAPNLPIMDGINAARLKFSSLWIDETKCADFLHCLSLYRKEWDDARGAFRDKPLHDFTSHYADAFRCFAVAGVEEKEISSPFTPSWVSTRWRK